MLKDKTPRQKQLDKVVESKIKAIGLDALFHLVESGKKERRASASHQTAGSQDSPLWQRLGHRLYFLNPRHVGDHLRNIYMNKPEVVIGVSVDSLGIKILELKEDHDVIRLNNAQYVPLPRTIIHSEEKSKEFITDTIAQILDPQTVKNAYVCSVIPRSKVIIKFFSLPTTDPGEIENMVKLEAEHHVPFALNECLFDYDILYYENNKAHLILVTIKKEEIEKHLRFLEKVGLKPSAVDISALTLHNTLAWEEASQERCMVHIYIGTDHTDINVAENGKLKTSRGIPWGCNALTRTLAEKLNVDFENAERMQKETGIVIKKTLKNDIADSISEHTCEWAQKLINEIKETIRHFQFQQGLAKIDRIVLTGDGSRVFNLDEYLKDQLEIKVSKQTPPKMFKQNVSVSPVDRSFSELSFLTGLAGRFKKEPSGAINLLPQKLRYAYEQRKLKVRQLTTFAIIIAAFLIILILPAGALGIRHQYIKHMDQKIAQLKPRATQLSALNDKVKTIEDYRSISRSCIEVLREISLLVSLDVSINQLTFEQNDHVTLIGEAESHVSVVNLSRALRESKLFEEATLKYTRKKDRLKKNVNFEIICKLSQ